MQSVKRIFAILRVIGGSPEGIGVTQIARQIGLPKGTVSRILAALEREGAVHRSEKNKLTVGAQLRALQPAVSLSDHLVAAARQTLEKLNRESGEAVTLGVLDGSVVTYIDHLPSRHQVQVVNWTSRSIPLHVTSSGKILLAFGTDELRTGYLSRPLERFAKKTIINPSILEKELAKVRKIEAAATVDEFAQEVSGYAVPIFDKKRQPLAALSLYGPTYRLTGGPAGENVIRLLKRGAREIETRLALSN